MLKIRLSRCGRKSSPSYRIVLMDSRKKRDGAYLDLLGTYNPFSKEIKIDVDLYNKYLFQGAQATPTVSKLFGIYTFSNSSVKDSLREKVSNGGKSIEV